MTIVMKVRLGDYKDFSFVSHCYSFYGKIEIDFNGSSLFLEEIDNVS